jgi:hypothetical protein
MTSWVSLSFVTRAAERWSGQLPALIEQQLRAE